jgi:hypothetical protein
MKIFRSFLLVFYLFNICVIVVSQEKYRHHVPLEPGFYYMLDFPVNIRSQPNLQGEIIGKLNLCDRIEIIENCRNEQQIENVWACWYKIKSNNIIGFVWGGYIAHETIKYDIDKNGIDDYLFYRTSDLEWQDGFSITIIDSRKDVIIYMNSKKISTDNLHYNGDYIFLWCWFRNWDGDEPEIRLYGRKDGYYNSFVIDSTGEIFFKERGWHE